jgi:succinyl-CoA synthetase beta subunit
MGAKIGELTFLKELAGRFKIPAPEFVVEPVNQSEIKSRLKTWGSGIVKPDVLAGERGKAGAVYTVSNYRDAMHLLKKVAATEVGGQQPRTSYMVQAVPADMELFSAVTYNSRFLAPSFTVSLRGGMDIESVPDSDKVTLPVDVFRGLNAYQASEALSKLGLQGKLNSALARCFVNQWDMFISTGMQTCEINPWRVSKNDKLYACDFKAMFDENNFKFRDIGFDLPEYPSAEDAFDEEMRAWSASSHQGQAHVSGLGGRKILPILFGGGASTIIIETLAQCGGDPMFLSDFGGNPPYERMKKTVEICFRHKLAHASLLLILGGKANNTQIDITLAAIADALEEWVSQNGAINIPVVIGRGGPGLVQGFAVMKKTLENLNLPYVIFGPDTPITLVAAYAAKLAGYGEKKVREGR